jgi:hypothetical protein
MRLVHLPTAQALAAYEGLCLELVNDLLAAHPTGHILWVDTPHHPTWRYHVALVLDGLVYDAWHPAVRATPAEYVRRVFGAGAEWEIDPGAEEENDNGT